ncbi:MAG: ribonuclease J [Patescibacteria group bacterium]
MALKFIALSGTVGVTENLYVYETDRDMMVVDCGVGFPDLEMPGVELVLPDFSYIIKNKNKLRGTILSQGHDDHVGALPFLLKEVNTPIWCTALVTEFLKVKFKDYGVKNYQINTFNPERDVFEVGSFKINSFRVTHSVPDTVGFAIDTPEGRIFHVAEHKMDQTSVDGMSFDILKAKKFADEKEALCLMSDCLGSNDPGYTLSGVSIEENLLKIAKNAGRGAIYMTAISSSIGRFQQMINVATKIHRKIVLVGRSIQSKVEIAYNLGYLKYLPSQIIDLKESQKYDASQIVYIIAGCYGQVGSSVYRLALGEHDRVKANLGDTFIFSADPGPAYSKEAQDLIVDELIDIGVDVHYYDLNEGLHVSGHGSQEDIIELFKIVKPKYFIPTGGTIRYMSSYQKLVVGMGKPKENVFRLKPGESVIFENGNARRGETIKTREVMVHGLGIGDIGKVVLEDRTALGKEGIVAVTLLVGRNGMVSKKPEMTSRGFVFEQKYRGILDDAANNLLDNLKSKKAKNIAELKSVTEHFLEKYFFDKTGRRPMVLPVVIEV